jgi:hypothetical protein
MYKACARLLLVATALSTLGAADASAGDVDAEKEAILAVISRMEAAWSRGDFRGYMEGFANPDVVFVSRGTFQDDWQGTLDHYQHPSHAQARRRVGHRPEPRVRPGNSVPA